MGSEERERVRVQTKIELLRKLEATAASQEPANLALLAAIRELLMEAEAELED